MVPSLLLLQRMSAIIEGKTQAHTKSIVSGYTFLKNLPPYLSFYFTILFQFSLSLQNHFIHIVSSSISLHFSLDTVKVNHTREEELNVLQGELASIQELTFAFRRASSRLFEIASEEYLAAWNKKHGGS